MPATQLQILEQNKYKYKEKEKELGQRQQGQFAMPNTVAGLPK